MSTIRIYTFCYLMNCRNQENIDEHNREFWIYSGSPDNMVVHPR